MTLGQSLQNAYQKLSQNQIPNYQLDAQHLLAGVIKQSRSYVLSHGEEKIKSSQEKKYQKLITLRSHHRPLAYLLGHQEFYGLDFRVNPQVLIPRPETEIIAETIIAVQKNNQPKTAIIDVGCGSGAIIIALAKNIKRPTDYYGLDISTSALRIARKNAQLNQIDQKIKFIASDLLSALPIKKIQSYPRIIIAANLPYLTAKQVKAEPSIRYEPRLAQLSGTDGLRHYRRLFAQIAKINHVNMKLIIEIDPSQAKKIEELTKKYWPKAKIKITVNRIVEIQI